MIPNFTVKEKKVMGLICEQYTDKQIAHSLSLSPRTISGYRKRLMKKTKAKNIIGVVIYMYKNNILAFSDIK